MRQQIKIFTTRTDHESVHQEAVNDFLKSNIELVSIQNEVHSGSAFNKYSRAEIVTIIVYKEMT